MNTPLDGIVVLCFAELYPGPYATALMADLGAEVIIIERTAGELGRAIPDFFAAFARGKRSVSINLKQPDSLERLTPLLRRADVVVEGFSPGTAARLHIDYDTLSKINPQLIYASISGFGQTGPYRDRAAHDLSYQSVAGLLADQASKPGTKPLLATGDVSAALFTVIGVLAALQGRAKNGRGSYIDVGVTDCLASCMAPELAPLLNGRPPLNVGDAPANGLFATSDGRVLSLSVLQEDHFWQALCDLLELPQYRQLDWDARAANADKVREELKSRIAAHPLAHWSAEFDRRRIAWSPVQGLEEVVRDPHMHARGLFAEAQDAQERTFRFVRQPLKFSSYANAPVARIPAIGEANAEFLSK
jgi:crotonobetainyl-CoA:carnitine CoA-transferase CaiB-like acyl-CoA transferase